MDISPRTDPSSRGSVDILEGKGKEQLFEAVLGSTPDLAYVFDLQHRFVYANSALLSMWGKTWEEAAGKNCLELGYEPWHAEMHGREIDEVASSGKPIRGEVPFSGRFGRRIYDYIFTPIWSRDGKVIAVAGTTRDVTERKEGEEKSKFLSELSKKLERSVDRKHAADEAVRMLAEFLKVSRCVFGECRTNDNLVTIESDWTAEGIESIRGDHELFRFGDRSWWEQYIQGDYAVDDVLVHEHTREQADAYLSVGIRSYAAQTYSADPNRVLLLSVNSSTPRSWTKRDLEVIEDVLSRLWPVVERLRVERELKHQSARLALLWKAAEILLKSEDPETMLQQIFDAISENLGLDVYINFLADGERLRLSSFRGIEPGQIEGIRYLDFGQAICGTVAQTGKAVIANRIEKITDPKAAAVKCMGLKAYICNPLVAGSEVLGTLSFGSRSRSSFSEEEAQFIETITHYVTAAYVRLRLMTDLRDSDKKKDQFLATLAHELRNPISPILTGLEVIRLSSGDPARIEKVSAMIRDQTRQMVHLIDDLLELSRISTGKIVLRRSMNDIRTIVADAIDVIRPLVEQKHQEISFDRPEVPQVVDCDPNRISQVVSNLLGNAVKYTQHGGKIQVMVIDSDESVQIVVSDNGVGIAPSSQSRIFGMFEQEDGDRQDGLGIGLTLVQTLTRLHGGSVALFSDGRDQGSRFTVSLPKPARGTAAEVASKPRDTNESDPVENRILIVDDERAAADMLRMMLESDKVSAEVAYDGIEAVERTRQFKPDIIFLDLGMPGMDGFEVARRIQEINPDIGLVALSGWGRSEDRERTSASGFVRHLVKPVSPADIWRVINELSAARQGR
ncbi:MAG TPA: ATP-binding protein [Luteolibacter sp.]|nr:ATP-binding protein [Luteolibacter sp.]